MRLSKDNIWLTIGLVAAIFISLYSSLLSRQNVTQLVDSAAKVQQSNRLLITLTRFYSGLLDAESGRRGYILSGDVNELERYYKSNRLVDSIFQKISLYPAASQNNLRLLDVLRKLNEDRKSIAQESIQLYQRKPDAHDSQYRLLVASQSIRQQIQELISQAQEREQRQLDDWIKFYQSSVNSRQFIEISSLLLGFLIIFLTFTLAYWQLIKRHQSETDKALMIEKNALYESKINFLSIVSHEFRTPLSLILGSVQTLLHPLKPLSEDRRNKNLLRIQAASRLMIQMLGDLLTFNRAEAGKLDFLPSRVDAESFCINLIEDFKYHNISSNEIIFSTATSCTYAVFDEKLMLSVLTNLLSNANKYSPGGKPIRLNLVCQSSYIEFQVQDQGIGIPSESIPFLFDPFYRAENARSNPGTGLGLAVVKLFVDLHHGSIDVETQPGVGTTFTVKIPQQGTL